MFGTNIRFTDEYQVLMDRIYLLCVCLVVSRQLSVVSFEENEALKLLTVDC
jgi:hypothetical protein